VVRRILEGKDDSGDATTYGTLICYGMNDIRYYEWAVNVKLMRRCKWCRNMFAICVVRLCFVALLVLDGKHKKTLEQQISHHLVKL
jgi:hypothetical protein